MQVIPDRGVVIRTAGALVQGVWGNGRIDNGLMVNLLEKPDDVLTSARLDVSLRGSVILGGHVRDVETLKVAAELPVRGLILSSISSSLIATGYQMRYPILVIEGFGMMPMNTAAFKLLTTNNKREATVNAEHFDRYTGNRPEVIVALPVSNEPAEPNNYETFAVGQHVRMRRPPNAGMIAASGPGGFVRRTVVAVFRFIAWSVRSLFGNPIAPVTRAIVPRTNKTAVASIDKPANAPTPNRPIPSTIRIGFSMPPTLHVMVTPLF